MLTLPFAFSFMLVCEKPALCKHCTEKPLHENCRRLLLHLCSGPASWAAGTPQQRCMLLAPPCLPVIFPQLPNCILQGFFFFYSAFSAVSWFPDVSLFLVNLHVSVCSSLKAWLHVLTTNRGELGGHCGNGQNSILQFVWPFSSAKQSNEMGRTIKSSNQNNPHTKFRHWKLQPSSWAYLQCRNRVLAPKVSTTKHFSSLYSVIRPYYFHWDNRGGAAQQSHTFEENGSHFRSGLKNFLYPVPEQCRQGYPPVANHLNIIISGFQQLKRPSKFSLSIFLSPTPFFPKFYPQASTTWLHDHLQSLRETYNHIS